MKIEIIEVDKKRSRTKCKIDGIYYNLPSGLIKKILKDDPVEYINTIAIDNIISRLNVIISELEDLK